MKICIFSMTLFLVFAEVALHAQTPAGGNTAPLCKPANIDATFSFADVPAGQQSISIHLHNMTPQPCTLRGELVPSFAVDGHYASIETCWLCTSNGTPDAEAIQRKGNFVLLADGDTQVTYRWRSVGDTCQKVDWATISVEWDGRADFLFSNRHWKPQVCSTMQISGYEAGAIGTTQPASSLRAELRVTVPPGPLYADELVQVTLDLKTPSDEVSPTGHCPELYAVYKDGLESTRFEAVLPDGYTYLVRNATDDPSLSFSSSSDELPAQFKGYMRLCETAGKRTTATVTLPASLKAPIHVVPQPTLADVRHIIWRVENSRTHEPLFVSADVHFDVVDPDILPPNWGPQVEGIGAGLSIDKTTFTLGETIPLHVRWENFSASKKLAVGECGDPQPQVEIQDESHHILGMFTNYDLGCMGHGWGPFAVESGKPQRNFVTLRYSKWAYFISSEAAPITKPGIYYLSAVWSPSTLIERTIESTLISPQPYERTIGEHYATARSLPVRIEIVANTN